MTSGATTPTDDTDIENIVASAKKLDINSSLADLQTEEQCRVLDTIAKIRKCGLEGDLSLPQLVVCGDQSAGKSSVLEALTEIPFPRNDNLCTRFATEIILRRANSDSLTIRVIPADERPASEKTEIKKFVRSIQDFKELPDVMNEAMAVMGVTEELSSDVDVPSKAFAKDVLSLEIEGPTRPQLTLVDIPGLIATSTRGVTTADVELVAEITNDYIKKPRTICLAVVSAANDYANQKILEKVREVDKQGNRTLGIITKPDRIEGPGSKKAFVELAQNKDIYFKLGWHVVKNRSATEHQYTLEQRKKAEAKWFKEECFQDLPSHCVGIDELRRRLSVLLFEHVKKELPKLRAELEVSLDDTQKQLDLMGTRRSTAAECRDYLAKLSITYQEICKAAVDGHYEGPYFRGGSDVEDDDMSRRTRAVVQRLNTEFNDRVMSDGHYFQIDMANTGEWKNPPPKTPRRGHRFVQVTEPEKISRAAALAWVRSLMIGSRGKELVGNFNPLIIGELFWAQACKWESLAKEHLHSVSELCRTFLKDLLVEKCPKDIQDRVHDFIELESKNRKKAAEDELAEILTDLDAYPINYNHYYTDNINKRRQARHREMLEKCLKDALKQQKDGTDEKTVIDIEKVVAAYNSSSDADMEKFACEEALDCMLAIYKVSQKTFIANITTQVVERHIVRGLETIFSPLFVSRLKDADAESIAAEPVEAQRERARLEDKLKKLNEGQEAFRSVMGVAVR